MVAAVRFSKLVHDVVYNAYFSYHAYGNNTSAKTYNLERLCHILEDRFLMAAKNGKAPQIERPKFETVKWVNRQLTTDEKEQHDAGSVRPEKTFKDLLALSVSGYNLTIKWDAYSKCFQATLVPYNTACANYGFGLSSRAADPYRAISLLLFKHYEILQEDWISSYRAVSSDFEG